MFLNIGYHAGSYTQGRTAGDLTNADLLFVSIPIAIGIGRKDAHQKPVLLHLKGS
jgi:hypothetical protein